MTSNAEIPKKKETSMEEECLALEIKKEILLQKLENTRSFSLTCIGQNPRDMFMTTMSYGRRPKSLSFSAKIPEKEETTELLTLTAESTN